MNKLIIVFISIGFIFIKTQYSIAKVPSYYSGAKLTPYKSYRINLKSEYFTTLELYDQDGIKLDDSSGSSFLRWDNDLNISYGLGRRLELSFGGKYRQINSTLSDETEEVTNSGVESFWGNIRYGFRPVEKWQYTIGVRYRMTTYSNNFHDTNSGAINTETIDLGDAGSEVNFGLYLDYYRNSGHVLSSYLAYNMPPNDLSSEVNYKLESAWPSKNWAFFIGVEGVYSLNEDKTDLNNPKPVFSTGATAQFNSINRSYNLPYIGVNAKLGIFLLGFRYGQTMNEISTDKGQQFLVSLDWNSKNTRTKTHQKLRKFKEYDVEASVIKISPRGKFLKLDKGLEDDVERGRKFDVYQTDYFGGNKLLASGIVVDIGSDWSIIKLVKKYRRSKIKKGYIARGY